MGLNRDSELRSGGSGTAGRDGHMLVRARPPLADWHAPPRGRFVPGVACPLLRSLDLSPNADHQAGAPSSGHTLEVNTMDENFESFNEQDDEWLAELETKVMDLGNELFDWREARARELAESGHGWERAPGRTTDTRASDAWTMEPRASEAWNGGARGTGARGTAARGARPRGTEARGTEARGTEARGRQILRVAGQDEGYDLDDG